MPQADTKLKLLGCPFCVKPQHGVSICTKREESTVSGHKSFWIVCNDCGLKSPKFRSVSNLVSRWNTRAKAGKLREETLKERLFRMIWEPLKWYR